MYPLLDLLRSEREGFRVARRRSRSTRLRPRPSRHPPLASVGGAAHQNDLLICRVEEDAGAAVLHVAGEVDLFTAPVLRMHLERLVEQGKDIVVLLAEVQYLDMAAIRVLEDVLNLALEKRSRVLLASPSPIARRVLEIVGMDRVFAIMPTKVAALTELHTRRSVDGPSSSE